MLLSHLMCPLNSSCISFRVVHQQQLTCLAWSCHFKIPYWFLETGGPGSGKGTQCSRLVKEFGFKHISLGDILREEVKQGTPIGKECSKIMKEGKLVPVNLTMELMKKAMKNSEGTTGYLLDGFPRATSQARAFQKQVNISLNPLLLQRITFWICFL